MAVTVKFKPTSEILKSLGIQKNGPAHAFFTATCDKKMDRYIPYRPHNGDHLRENKDIGINYIAYNMPYAYSQYIGYTSGPVNPDNYTTPGTGPYWDKKMWSVEKDNIVKEVQEYVNTHGG